MKVYLITGFLGAGKTTFLKNAIPWFSDCKLGLIINEFGREGIDALILKRLGVLSAQINNGSIFCACRLDQFENALKKMQEENYDCVIVEASGLTDPRLLDKVLAENEVFSSIDYCGCICLVDAINFEKVLSTAIITKKQILDADIILLNKTDLAAQKKLHEVHEQLKSINPKAAVFETQNGVIDREKVFAISRKKYNFAEAAGLDSKPDLHLQKLTLKLNEDISKEKLIAFVERLLLFADRVKGFVKVANERLLVDCAGEILQVGQYEQEIPTQMLQRLVLLSGGTNAMTKKTKLLLNEDEFSAWKIESES